MPDSNDHDAVAPTDQSNNPSDKPKRRRRKRGGKKHRKAGDKPASNADQPKADSTPAPKPKPEPQPEPAPEPVAESKDAHDTQGDDNAPQKRRSRGGRGRGGKSKGGQNQDKQRGDQQRDSDQRDDTHRDRKPDPTRADDETPRDAKPKRDDERGGRKPRRDDNRDRKPRSDKPRSDKPRSDKGGRDRGGRSSGGSTGKTGPNDRPIDDVPYERPLESPNAATDEGSTADVSKHPFTDLGLTAPTVRGVARLGFENPTDIQRELIPAVLDGVDVIGQARTGTGKTAAFALPFIDTCEPDIPMQALILTPTRELAVQVAAEINQLARYTTIRATPIIGGESSRQQRRAVESGAQIMTGTPGRVMDMHARRAISFRDVDYVVLDEVDRMFDIGFRDDIRKILKQVARDRHDDQVQTVFVSATLTNEIEALARKHMNDEAEKIQTVEGALTVNLVDQHYVFVEPWDKRVMLLKLLRTEKPETTIVFCRTKATVRKVSEYLRDKGIKSREIHGDLQQSKRNTVIRQLKDRQVDVLIASDLAARGLDVSHITHVVNYDLPEDPDIYVHRIGRTARAGRRGTAWSFTTPEEGQQITEIEKLTGAQIDRLEVPDFEPGPIPRGVLEERERDEKRQAKRTSPESRVMGVDSDELSDDEKAKLFPGGVVPVMKKKKGLGGKFKRRGR